MKKFISMLIVSIVALFLGTTITSCDNIIKHDCSALSSADSTKLMTAIDQYHNPLFFTAADFCEFVDEELTYYDFVSVAGRLHKNTVLSIASTVVQQNGSVDYRAFIQEYVNNKQLYDNVDRVNKEATSDVPIRGSVTVSLSTDTVSLMSNQMPQ